MTFSPPSNVGQTRRQVRERVTNVGRIIIQKSQPNRRQLKLKSGKRKPESKQKVKDLKKKKTYCLTPAKQNHQPVT